ncbi:MAG: orotidine-5-phosphate decarboxylase [Candidatus Solibacter sp.]|jgi:orotidine-5'-phosphate decarboxylase|nr:orotidine-5-phosphate decarboxylase [Candidatus Solibacter sp.]
MTTKAMHNPIIVALDVESASEARAMVARIGPQVGFYKVGLELYTAAGMEVVRELLGEGKQVFLDLKMYDIPETVSRAVAQVAKTGVRFLTVHAIGSVMRAAVAARAGSGLQILGVTVLTSFGPEDMDDLGFSGTIAELVERRARKAAELGVDGVVASPLEAAAVRRAVGERMTIVTPGVRSAGVDAGDQKRVATPAQAMIDGANYLVIGRQITRASDPAGAVDRVLMEIAEAFAGR